MEQLICPLDGRPCEADCPDRYREQPEGGCILTTFMELGGNILYIRKAPVRVTTDKADGRR